MKKLFVIVCFLLLAVMQAQAGPVKKQVFFGSGLVSPWSGGTKSLSMAGGFAVILPVSQKMFLRPLIAGGANVPLNSATSVPLLQMGALVGFKFSTRVAILSGGALIVAFPPGKPSTVLPTALFSSAWKLTRKWGISTPIAVNKKGAMLAFQVGYTW